MARCTVLTRTNRPKGPTQARAANSEVIHAISCELSIHVIEPHGEPQRVGGVFEGGAELTNEHRGDVLLHNEAEVLVPESSEVAGKSRVREPRKIEGIICIFVHRVNQLVWHIQPHRVRGHSLQVAAPPAVVRHALHDDQPVRIHRLDSVTHSLGGQIPVCVDAAAAPRAGMLWLVPQVCSNHSSVCIALGQHHPVCYVSLLRVVRVPGDVPQ
mmetsp:Transcript_14826/g.20320  ORF Transcript_14826/g.20320 Transcript_14826/m.20320 type:complete len:213 (-) Transcript_14826:212-850(-)